MSIILKAIKFNHDPGSINNDAITIRKNKTQTISVPEWVDGISTTADDSLAAYAITETSGNILTIQARFQTLNEDASLFEIRAIDGSTNPRNPGGCIGWLIKLIQQILKAIFGNVLGEVQSQWVDFIVDDSGFVTFNLTGPRIWTAGVGIYFTEWQWQYRSSRKVPWQNMQMSRHKIYVLVAGPKAPWNQTAGSDHLPWTDVLNYSCNWARGAITKDQASIKITEQVYNLGNSLLQYDCPGDGDRHYATDFDTFDCTKFLEKLHGLYGNGEYVNCTDCATIVTTFANILGAELWASRMELYFNLNPILAIGSSTWQTACKWGGFRYHEVAWKNNCDVNDEIFDACLKVDGDADPRNAPHTPLLPANLKFGDCSTMDYRLRLCPPGASGCDTCQPVPATRVRRTVF